MGLIFNTNRTALELAVMEPSPTEVDMHMAYVEQQNLDGYAQMVLHVNRRKATFDKHVLKTHPKEVIFKLGDLVQVHRSDLTFTHNNDQKLTPRWSLPFHIALHICNAYKLQTLNGSQAKGEYSTGRLWHFYPQDGTQLAADQERYMAKERPNGRMETTMKETRQNCQMMRIQACKTETMMRQERFWHGDTDITIYGGG